MPTPRPRRRVPRGKPAATRNVCGPDEVCFEQTCIANGPLRFSLSWTASTDLDLHVRAPDGTEVSYLERRTEIGQLDLDDCAQRRCRTEGGPHVENIVFGDEAPPGRYEAWVENFDGLAEASFELQVAAPSLKTFEDELPRQSRHSSPVVSVVSGLGVSRVPSRRGLLSFLVLTLAGTEGDEIVSHELELREVSSERGALPYARVGFHGPNYAFVWTVMTLFIALAGAVGWWLWRPLAAESAAK